MFSVNYNVYIGYDEREKIAAEVCRYSIQRRLVLPADIKFLRSQDIPAFTRPREPQQSTDFTYTRFMIPFIESYRGLSIFCDCDFLFLTNILELILTIDRSKAISVCKHPAYIPRSQIKMDGVVQHQMPRKNWASLIVFNNEHSSNRILTPDYINTIMPGRKLHTFDWLKDEEIGSIPLNWNALDDYYLLDNPMAIHYTDGGPWFENYKNTMYSQHWLKEHESFTRATK
jgi:lipopolysaccharide biosynthesis glycosyltransferase